MSFAPANGPSRPRETAFARQNGASRPAGSHLPDKTGPRVAREDICSGKWGLALRGKTFARQNGASRIAGRHLPDKTGPREPRNAICPTKWGLARSRNAIWSTKWDLVNPRTITHPLISYISRSSTPDCPPRRALPSFSASTRSGASKRVAKAISSSLNSMITRCANHRLTGVPSKSRLMTSPS